MTQIKKLEIVVKEFEDKAENFRKESIFCRERNFKVEAQILNDKRELIEDMCRSIRLKVIEQLIAV